MTADELKRIIRYLQARVSLVSPDDTAIHFEPPTQEEMVADGMNAGGVEQLLSAAWWAETVEDVVETPDFCDPDDSPEAVLEYARDVIQEAIWKRFAL